MSDQDQAQPGVPPTQPTPKTYDLNQMSTDELKAELVQREMNDLRTRFSSLATALRELQGKIAQAGVTNA